MTGDEPGAAAAAAADDVNVGGDSAAGAGAPADGAADPLSEETRTQQREALAAHRRRPDRRAKGLTIVYTGDGKGKTTAALGLVLRASGQGLKAAMFQFVKAKSGNWGESRAGKTLGVAIEPLGSGFTWTSDDLERDRALAREGWERCRAAIEEGGYDLVVLDEITYCLTFGWLDLDEVLETLRHRPPHQHVVLTGRGAPEALIAFADTVTEMRPIKHAYDAGIKAQKGIEF
jgi:cob(I)alamin adenosyltransferase